MKFDYDENVWLHSLASASIVTQNNDMDPTTEHEVKMNWNFQSPSTRDSCTLREMHRDENFHNRRHERFCVMEIELLIERNLSKKWQRMKVNNEIDVP